MNELVKDYNLKEVIDIDSLYKWDINIIWGLKWKYY